MPLFSQGCLLLLWVLRFVLPFFKSYQLSVTCYRLSENRRQTPESYHLPIPNSRVEPGVADVHQEVREQHDDGHDHVDGGDDGIIP